MPPLMRLSLIALVSFVVTVCVDGGAAAAQQPPPPPRPARDAPPAVKPTGVIKGRVLSADGRPLRRAQVRVTAPELRDTRQASTDTEGNYEIAELPAGRYTVRVTRSGYLGLSYGQRYPGELGRPVQVDAKSTVDNIDIILPRSGVIAGRITDEIGDPIGGVIVFAMQQRFFQGGRRVVPVESNTRTDDTGQYRIPGLPPGDYYILASTRESWVVGGKEKTTLSFAPTYYPGTPVITTAQRLKVGIGTETPGIDFSLAIGRAASISGVAMNSAGMPIAAANVSLGQEFAGPQMAMMSSVSSAVTGADGSWKISSVGPGEYTLSMRTADSGSTEGASQRINIDGTDIEGVTLMATVGGTVSGQVVLDANGTMPTALTRLRVVMRPVDRPVARPSQRPQNGAVDDQGRFELDGMIGSVRLNVTGVPDGWIVKGIERDGRDITDTDLQLRSGERWDNVRVVLTDRVTTVTGIVTNEKDGQNAMGTVVVFSDDNALWGDGSRHVRGVRPSHAGAFEIKGLLPGNYLAIAVEYLREGDWFDPEVLESLRDRATKLVLLDNEVKTVNLQLKN